MLCGEWENQPRGLVQAVGAGMMEYAWAVPGAKVECIAKKQWVTERGKLASAGPVKGKIYTIKGVEEAYGYIFLILEEFAVDRWNARGFRPLNEKDAELFAQLLEPLPQFADLLEPVE